MGNWTVALIVNRVSDELRVEKFDTLPVLGDSSGKNILPEKSSAEE